MAKLRLPSLRRDAARQVTGTSYESQGSQQNAPMAEIGSGAGVRVYDPVPELGTKFQARLTYTKMKRSDSSVRVSLRAGKAPVLGADFFMEAASETPEDLLINEFVEYNLFKGMTVTWLKLVEQILAMFENGFQPFEPVWELREWSPDEAGANRKRYTMLRKLAVRPASTISEIIYDDNGGPVEVVQQAIRADRKIDEVHIPIGKLCIFTFDQEDGDLEGNSILRSAYQNWYYKTHLYKLDAIQKERHAIGVPEVELQPGYSETDRKIANELARNLRANEKAYIVRTTMMKIGFADLGSQPVNILHSINHHDDMIMKNIMVQFLNAGVTEGGGNRATSATSMDMFLKAMRYIAQSVCDAINMYIIPNLVSYNFKVTRFPNLSVRNIGETKDLQAWASAMSNLIKNNAIMVDDETEQWIRKVVQAPQRTTPYVAPEPKGKQPPQNKNGNQPDAGNIPKATDQAPVG